MDSNSGTERDEALTLHVPSLSIDITHFLDELLTATHEKNYNDQSTVRKT